MNDLNNENKFVSDLTSRANILSALGRYDKALVLLLQALQKTPDDDWLHYKISIMHSYLSNIDEAEKFAKTALQLNSENDYALNRLTWFNLYHGNNKQALIHAKDAVNINASESCNHYMLAQVYDCSFNRVEAINTMKTALKLDPNIASYHGYIGSIYCKIKDFLSSEKHYKISLSLEPERSETHQDYGHFLVENNKIYLAAKHFINAIKLAPESYNYLGDLYPLLTIDMMNTILMSEPNDSMLNGMIAEKYYENKNWIKCALHITVAIKNNPSEISYEHMLNNIAPFLPFKILMKSLKKVSNNKVRELIADEYFRVGKLMESELLYRKILLNNSDRFCVISNNPDNKHIHYSLGLLLSQKKQHDEAIKHLLIAARSDHKNRLYDEALNDNFSFISLDSALDILKNEPKNPRLNEVLVNKYYELKKLGKSRKSLQVSITNGT